jgi:hypothetical protein
MLMRATPDLAHAFWVCRAATISIPTCKLYSYLSVVIDRTSAIDANDRDDLVNGIDAVASEGVSAMLSKTMIVLVTAGALTGGSIDAFALGHGGGGGHAGGFGGGGHGFASRGHIGGFAVGGSGGARLGGAYGLAGSHYAGSHFGHDRSFDHDRHFDRRFRFAPSWDYGVYDDWCSYGYQSYYDYGCHYSPTY